MLPDIFGFIHMYGLMIGIGVIVAYIILFSYSKILSVNGRFVDFIFYDALASIVIGFLSAALFQATYNYIENPDAGFHFGSGITFIGGLLGGAICFLCAYFLLSKRLGFRGKLNQLLSVLPCSILVAHGFGRIGCFFAGCCYGKETDCFLGVTFPGMSSPVHPTQLYEAAFLFIMFGICSLLLLRFGIRHNLSIYLVSYGIFRFLIEFLRGDDRGALLGPVSPSQFWSIIMIAVGVAVFFIERYLNRKTPPIESSNDDVPTSNDG